MKSVDIAFPVYHGNLAVIEQSILTVYQYAEQHLTNYQWRLVLAINGPFPEKVIALTEQIAKTHPRLSQIYTPTPGKGAGLKAAWCASSADILAYMDIDLSVDLSALVELLNSIDSSDAVVGSRYHADSQVKRGLKRKIVSKIYHALFQKIFLGVHYDDAHCGFKAIRGNVAKTILPHVQDTGWYFDSELMYLLDKLGYSIKSIPVKWRDAPNPSGVNLKRVIPGFILKTLEMKLRPLPTYARKGS